MLLVFKKSLPEYENYFKSVIYKTHCQTHYIYPVHNRTSWGHAVAQLVQALRYKPAGRAFDSR